MYLFIFMVQALLKLFMAERQVITVTCTCILSVDAHGVVI